MHDAALLMQGARESNEDCHGQLCNPDWALGYMMDGHNGRDIASALEQCFVQRLKSRVAHLGPTCGVENIAQVISFSR